MAAADFGVGTAANVSATGIIGIFQEIKRHVRYVIVHKENLKNFEDKMELLNARRESVRQKVDVAERNLERILPEVQLWCERVDKTIDDEVKNVKDLENEAKAKCFLGLCPNIKSRYQLSRKTEDVTVVNELLQQGQFDKVGFRDVLEAPISAAAKKLTDFDSRKVVFDEIVEALKDSKISMIGVYGPGGVGKTTLVNEVARCARETGLFCPVVVVTVTLTPNLKNIQERIAVSLGLELKEEDTSVRAGLLSKRLENEKKILIVLDDIWAGSEVKKVGIPFGDEYKGCKILLTSRNRHVLTNEMDAKTTFAMDNLKENEAWDLFKKMAENDFENPELQSVAIEVAKRCARLPLAIVTVASALKNKELHEWEDALRQLQRPSPENSTGISKEVHSAIQLSYDNLESEELRKTFLLSCLLGNNAYLQDLLRCSVGLYLFHGVNTVAETRNKALTMVSKLRTSCLLLDGYGDRLVVHDLVWDFAIAIASMDNHAFVLRDGDDFEDWEGLEKFKMICLSFATVKKKLPHELECPQLSLFSMGTSEWNSFWEMPLSFFEKMEKIEVLNLIQADFLSSASASSISFPTSLRTLCLKRCRLGDIVSLGKLKNLEILSLSESNIERLPEETRQLTKLRSLDLTGCTELKIIPPGVLSSLSRLEELLMGGGVIVGWNQEGNARLYELKELLSRLTALEICIIDAEIVKENLLFEKLQRYKIVIGVEWERFEKFENTRAIKLRVNTSIDHLDDGFKGLLKKTEASYLEDLKGVEIVLNQVSNRDCFLHLSHLEINYALEIQYIMNDNDAVGKIVFRQLRSLTLKNLPSLVSFCSKNRYGDPTSACPHELPLFDEQMELPFLKKLYLSNINVVGRIWHNHFLTLKSLTKLVIRNCDNLKDILSSSTAKSLAQLKRFDISDCKCLREIIFSEDIEEDDKVAISFPQLRILTLQDLEHFIGFCSENYNIIFPSLKTLVICDCPELKEFIYKSTKEDNTLLSIQALFDEKVAFPQLEELRLSDLKNCRKIWHNQLVGDSFLKLNNLSVWNCEKILNVLSFNMSKRLQNLTDFRVGSCNLLEEILELQMLDADELHDVTATPSIAEETATSFVFPKLTFLYFNGLPKLKSFYSKMHTTKWPSLKAMELCGCDMVEIIFASESLSFGELTNQQPLFWVNEVSFSQLEKLRFSNLKNCRKIWQDQLSGDSFSKLNDLSVWNCDKLLNIFSFNMRETLQNLTVFKVRCCNLLEEVFAPQFLDTNELHAVTATPSIEGERATSFVFSKLTSLHLTGLPKLKSFYSKMHTTKWPSLKQMELCECEMVEIIFASVSLSFGELTNQQPLFWVNEDTFPNLEELKLKRIPRMTWHRQLQANVFSKLRVLEFENFSDTSTHSPNIFIQSLPNLEKLVVSDAAFSQIFNLEGFGSKETDELVLTSLNEISLAKLPQLTHLRKEECNRSRAFYNLWSLEVKGCGKLKNLLPSSVSFQNLTALEIFKCHGIVNLIACSTAKSLVHLTRMNINDCEMMEEIVACEGDEVNGDIVFTRLEHLKLSYLPSLASFCLGKHNFDFPTLEEVSVIGCPKMKIFSGGDLSTPMLQGVHIEHGDEGSWEGNLNATIQWLFAEKIEFREIEKLSFSDSSKWIEIWRNHEEILCFKSLTSLEVHDCSTLRCLFTVSIALDLPQLRQLKVLNCTMMEHVILDEGSDEEVGNKIVFPRLYSTSLKCCADLASFYQGSKILKCPSLQILEVINCPKMFAFASKLSGETIDDGGNTSSRFSNDAAFFDNKVEFPRLKGLMINRLGNCKKIWHDHLIDDSFSNLFILRVWNCDKLLNVFSFNMNHRLENLMEFKVGKCDSLEEIFEPQVLNPESHAMTATESIVFASLECLHLSYLPSLASFCSEKHNFEFPTLERMFVRECPKMKIFCKGDLSAPELQKVLLTKDEQIWRWEGNLKATIQRLSEEMNVQNAEDDDEGEDENMSTHSFGREMMRMMELKRIKEYRRKSRR